VVRVEGVAFGDGLDDHVERGSVPSAGALEHVEAASAPFLGGLGVARVERDGRRKEAHSR
jgi:hypothetical protein